MSQIYISALVIILVQLNAAFGLDFGTEALTNVASTVVTFALAAWIAFRRQQQGDITVAGTRK